MLTTVLVLVIVSTFVQNVVHSTNGAREPDEADESPVEPSVMPMISPVSYGTGPHWDNDTQTLYYVSLFGETVMKYVEGSHFQSKMDGIPTFIIPIEGKPHHFAVGLDRKVVEVEWRGGDGAAKVIRTIAEVDKEHPDNRLNHGKADPRGRLFAGTMPAKTNSKKIQGSLYRFEAEGTPHKVLEGIGVANGFCWDLADKAFYFIDNLNYSIRRYDYDVETGDISNSRIVFAMQDHEYILTNTEHYDRGDTQTELDGPERYVESLIEGDHNVGRQGDRPDYDDGGPPGFNEDDKFESHDVDEGGLLDYNQGGQDYVESDPVGGRRRAPQGHGPGGPQGHAPAGRQGYGPDGAQGHAPTGRQGYGPGGPQGHAPASRKGYGPDGPQGHAPAGSQGYGPDGAQGHAPTGRQGYGPGGPQGHAPASRKGYGPDGPQGHAPAGRQGYGPDGPQGHAPVARQGYTPGGPQHYAPGSPQDFAPGRRQDFAPGQKGYKKSTLTKLPGILDGMTIDTEGNLWVANYNGSQMLKIDPKKGNLLQVVTVPASLVTSATFGDPDLDVLYVTSAATSSKGQTLQHSPAGATFSICCTGAKGHPNNKVRFNNPTTRTNGTKAGASKVLK